MAEKKRTTRVLIFECMGNDWHDIDSIMEGVRKSNFNATRNNVLQALSRMCSEGIMERQRSSVDKKQLVMFKKTVDVMPKPKRNNQSFSGCSRRGRPRKYAENKEDKADVVKKFVLPDGALLVTHNCRDWTSIENAVEPTRYFQTSKGVYMRVKRDYSERVQWMPVTKAHVEHMGKEMIW